MRAKPNGLEEQACGYAGRDCHSVCRATLERLGVDLDSRRCEEAERASGEYLYVSDEEPKTSVCMGPSAKTQLGEHMIFVAGYTAASSLLWPLRWSGLE
jgi:hypothetical protein